MDNRKENIILTGSGHKGIVKIQSTIGTDCVKGTCNLDFRPNNAVLYLIGDNIAQIRLKDVNTAFEVPFCANTGCGCVVRSSTVTMFGGAIQKSVALKRIEEFNAQHTPAKTTASSQSFDDKQQNITFDNVKELSELTKYDGNNFYYAVKPQIDEMFVCYPQETSLQNAIPSSRWVRIDEESGYYAVGLIFENQTPSFICYGVPANKDTQPPKEIQDACSWIDVIDENVDGYWVIFQSAKNGKIK